MTYLWTTSKEKDALRNAVDLLLVKDSSNEQQEDMTDTQKTNLLFTVFYEQHVSNTKELECAWNLPKNVIPCSDPDTSLDFSSATDEAQSLFYICEPSEAEFMPASEQEPEDDN